MTNEIDAIHEDELALEKLREISLILRKLTHRYISAFDAITRVSLLCDEFYNYKEITKGGEKGGD